ncbi:MAG: hypothetical protein GX297_06995 [Treponema sp.]|nr:hypothetical protein [Treponema sp.]
MNELLTGIQRDVVIQYLRTELPTLTISGVPQFDNTFKLDAGTYIIRETVIIFPKNVVPLWLHEIKSEVLVSFYFNRRGLQFNSVLQTKGESAAIGIAKEIAKTIDTETFNVATYNGKLFYNIDKRETNKSENFVACVSNELFPLFTPFVWQTVTFDDEILFYSLLSRYSFLREADVPLDLAALLHQTGKMLFFPGKRLPSVSPFPYGACFLARDLDNRSPFADNLVRVRDNLHILADCVYVPISKAPRATVVSIDRSYFGQTRIEDYAQKCEFQLVYLTAASFLAQYSKKDVGSVLGRVPPIDILYISDVFVCLGCELSTISLTERQEYVFEFRAGIRVITARCIVIAVLVENARVAVICRFESLKPEDKRFLYEKHYDAMLR